VQGHNDEQESKKNRAKAAFEGRKAERGGGVGRGACLRTYLVTTRGGSKGGRPKRSARGGGNCKTTGKPPIVRGEETDSTEGRKTHLLGEKAGFGEEKTCTPQVSKCGKEAGGGHRTNKGLRGVNLIVQGRRK